MSDKNEEAPVTLEEDGGEGSEVAEKQTISEEEVAELREKAEKRKSVPSKEI